MAMKLTDATRPTIERLAGLTNDDIARIALKAAQRAFESLVEDGVVIGATGDPNALHMRVGRAVAPEGGGDAEFVEWGSRTLASGAEFAKNTGQNGKAGTAAEFELGSGDAFIMFGDAVGEGPRQYTGADFVPVIVPDTTDPSGYKYLDAVVGSASGAQGHIDWIPSATAARTLASLTRLREEAQKLLATAQVQIPAEDATISHPADTGEELDEAARDRVAMGVEA